MLGGSSNMLGGRRLSGTRLAWEGTWRVFRTDHPLVFSFFQSEMSQDSLKDAGYDQVVEVNEAILSAAYVLLPYFACMVFPSTAES